MICQSCGVRPATVEFVSPTVAGRKVGYYCRQCLPVRTDWPGRAISPLRRGLGHQRVIVAAGIVLAAGCLLGWAWWDGPVAMPSPQSVRWAAAIVPTVGLVGAYLAIVIALHGARWSQQAGGKPYPIASGPLRPHPVAAQPWWRDAAGRSRLALDWAASTRWERTLKVASLGWTVGFLLAAALAGHSSSPPIAGWTIVTILSTGTVVQLALFALLARAARRRD